MALRAVKKATYDTAVSRAAQLKELCQDSKAAMESGPVSANVIKQLLELLIQVKAENQQTAAVPGISTYAQAQEGDPGYDVAAEWTAMNAAIDAVGAQILSDVPTGAQSYRLTEQWSASGITVRTFTTAQTANLRTAIDALIATIN